MRRAISAGLAAVAISATLAGPALASKPLTETFVFEETFDLDCGPMLVQATAAVTVRQTLWLDDDGNPVRALDHVTYDGVITGAGGIGSLSDRAHYTNIITAGPGETLTVRQVGLVYNYLVPGIGLVAHDVGSITFFPDGSVAYSGPHDVFEEGLESLICGLFED